MLLPLICSGDWILISGEYTGDWRVELTSEIKSRKKNTVIILDYFEPYDFSNIYNSQQAILLDTQSKGNFSETVIKKPQSSLKRLLIRMDDDHFFMNRSYRVKTYLSLENLLINLPYPFSGNLTREQKENLVLHQNVSFLRETIGTLTEKEDKTTDVILKIYSWIRNHIQLVNDSRYFSIPKILKRRQANLQGMLDLWVHSLRLSGIPSRIVHGYSLPGVFQVKTQNMEISCLYPRGEYHWLEVFLEGIGWFPIDPFANTFFFIPPNLVRKTSATYYNGNLDQIYVYPRKPADLVFNSTIFSEKEIQDKSFKVTQAIPNNDLLLSPPTVFEEVPEKKDYYVSRYLPRDYNLYGNPLKIDVEVTPDGALTQKTVFHSPKRINHVEIPLYFLELTRVGKVWVELENKGKSYRSRVLSSQLDKLHSRYRIMRFTFPDAPVIEGETRITLKIKNLATVFWYGVIGNPIGDKLDTFRKKEFYLHVDLCYEID
jgi:DNA-binding HxlR family transcriptional regulator